MMNKVILLILATNTFFNMSFSQIKNKGINKWQAGISINTVEQIIYLGNMYPQYLEMLNAGERKMGSYNLGLTISYYHFENFGLRLSAKRTDYNFRMNGGVIQDKPVNGPYEVKTWAVKSSAINMAPGIFWYSDYSKLNLYGGVEVIYKRFNNVQMERNSSWYDTLNIMTSSNNTYFNQDGGYSIGVGSFLGFSVKIFNRFSIGTEIGYAISYYEIGGKIEVIDTNLLSPFNSTSQIWSGVAKGFEFSQISGLFNISMDF